jgi:hypothetical protein
MRLRNLVAVAAGALLVVPSALLGQSLGEAAAKEKARRKALEESRKKPTRSYTDDDLGRVKGTNASFPTGSEAAPEESTEKKDGGTPEAKEKEKTEDEKRAEASAAWRKKLDKANQDVTTLRDQANKIQTDANDMSGGLYSTRRTTLLNLLDDTKKKLAEAEQRVSTLEDEGRRNGY